MRGTYVIDATLITKDNAKSHYFRTRRSEIRIEPGAGGAWAPPAPSRAQAPPRTGDLAWESVTTGDIHEDHQGPGASSSRSSRATRRRSTRSTRSAAGRPRSATRACRSRPGTPACSTCARRPSRMPIATRSQGVVAEARPRDHRALDPSAGPARRGPSGLSTRPSTASRRRRCAAIRRRARNGRSSR